MDQDIGDFSVERSENFVEKFKIEFILILKIESLKFKNSKI